MVVFLHFSINSSITTLKRGKIYMQTICLNKGAIFIKFILSHYQIIALSANVEFVLYHQCYCLSLWQRLKTSIIALVHLELFSRPLMILTSPMLISMEICQYSTTCLISPMGNWNGMYKCVYSICVLVYCKCLWMCLCVIYACVYPCHHHVSTVELLNVRPN